MRRTVLRCSCLIRLGALLGLCWLGQAQADGPRVTILQDDQGEHLTRRWGYPLTIKVDPLTAGATSFSIGTEDIAPGKAIPAHRHMHAEEVVIVQSGTVLARVGEQTVKVEAGGMAFAPADTWMSYENIGPTTARVIWIFSKPGFEEYVRATSVPAGQPVVPLSAQELSAIRERYKQHIDLAQPVTSVYQTEVTLKEQ